MKKTKIVCTIGPASNNRETLIAMCKAGMNVARLNFSHGTLKSHQETIDLIKEVRSELGMPIAIMLDTKGPEYRLGTFENGKIELKDGDIFTFTTDDIVGDRNRVSVNYKGMMNEMKVGDGILVNNGLVIFEVIEVKENEAVCRTVSGGVLSDHKSMNFPGKVFNREYVSEQDRRDILFGVENDVDFVAASFVSRKSDMEEVRKLLDENGGSDIEIIAKIENRSGVENIDEICEIADGVMVARGDLGVEIPFIEVPAIQKELIKKCRLLGKRVVTATEMLESMIEKPRPTRAEISDVANAVYDGSSAIMLSGESASGKHPVEAVKVMAEIAEFTELNIDYKKRFYDTEFIMKNNLDAVSHATCAMAIDVNAKCIVVNSKTGKTARMVSRFRCPVQIIGNTTDEKAWRQLNLSWGVYPVLTKEYTSIDIVYYKGMEKATELLDLQPGDNVVLTGGQIAWKSGDTNTIRVERVQ